MPCGLEWVVVVLHGRLRLVAVGFLLVVLAGWCGVAGRGGLVSRAEVLNGLDHEVGFAPGFPGGFV